MLLVFVAGCGVKARPKSPPEKAISSYVESYTQTPFEDSNSKKEKKK